jgi:hypothetical protein
VIKVRVAGIAGLLAASAICAGVIVPAFSAAPAKPVISQEASAAMTQMGQTLLAKQFSFQARTLRVYADTDGRFLHIGHALKVVVRRPDRLRADIDGDDGVNQLFYDGKTLVLYSAAKKEYLSISGAGYDRGGAQRGDEPHWRRLSPGGFPQPGPEQGDLGRSH